MGTYQTASKLLQQPLPIPSEPQDHAGSKYQEQYFDLSIRHFHEKLQEEHGIEWSYTWVQQALPGAGLVKRRGRRGPHRRRRERRPLPGLLLHIVDFAPADGKSDPVKDTKQRGLE